MMDQEKVNILLVDNQPAKAKYGALSALSGRLSVGWDDHAGLLKII